MGHNCCCVVNCNNTGRNSKCKFYTFPTASWKVEKRKKWINACKRKNVDGSPWIPRPTDTICSAHFIGGKKTEEEASPSYIPTIFPSVYKKPKINEKNSISRHTCFLNRRKIKNHITAQTITTTTSQRNDITMDFKNDIVMDRNEQVDKSCQVDFLPNSDEAGKTFICNRYMYVNADKCDAEIQTVTLTDMNYEDDNSLEHEDIKIKIENVEETSLDIVKLEDGRIKIENVEETSLDIVKHEVGRIKIENIIEDTSLDIDIVKHEIGKIKIENIEDTSIDNNVIVKQEYEYTYNEPQTSYDVFQEFNEEKHIIDENILRDNCISGNLLHESANDESESETLEIAQKKELKEEFLLSDASYEDDNSDKDAKEIRTLINSYISNSNEDILKNNTQNQESTSSTSTDENALKCNECQKLFKHRSNLFRHKLIHTKEKRFQCDLCDKQFNRSDLLTTHKRVHTGEKPFKCDTCDKAFSEKSRLTYHQRTHTGEIPYTCEVCNKTFNLLFTFKNHLLTHTGEKPFKCEVCDISFSHSSSFVKHKRIHTGEKPYKCDECDKEFRYTHGLKRHKVKHTGEKPYKCDVCDQAFQYTHVLKRHRMKHTEETL